MKKSILTGLLTCLMTLGAGSQVDFISRVDSTSMLLGDQQNLVFRLSSPAGVSPADIHTEALDTCSYLELVNEGTWTRTEENQQVIQQKTIRFTIFDEGQYVIPSCYVAVGMDTFRTYPIPMVVAGIEPDTTGLLPIKGIIKEQARWTDYLGWILGIVVLLFAYLAYRYFRNRRAKKERIAIPVPEIPLLPHEIALQKLNDLKQSRIWEQGEVKEFHVQLTHILREYLEHRYLIPALESTSMEIIRDIRSKGLSQEQVQSTDDLLHVADWVKFARGNPEENTNALALEHCIELVKLTAPPEPEPMETKPN